MTDDWRKPYSSLDMAGDADSCASVGWRWINEQAGSALGIYGHERCEIDTQSLGGGNGVMVLYVDRQPFAVATLFRTPLNRSTLIRWMAE